VKEGEFVRVGTPLLAARVEDYGDSDLAEEGQLDSEFADSSDGVVKNAKIKVVKSNFEGIVYQLPVRPGSEYKSYMNLAVIARSGNPSVTVFASAKARSSLKEGDDLNLVVQGESGADVRIHGKVTEVAMSPIEQYSRETRTTYRTYRVDIKIGSEVDSGKGRDLIGKTVEVRMPLQKRRLYQWFFDPLKRIFDDE
jgi:HlyD family secretion protein